MQLLLPFAYLLAAIEKRSPLFKKTMMDRIEFIQRIFRNTNFENYLEIGCEEGDSFLPIAAKNKIAVDPNFQIPFSVKLKWMFKQPRNIRNQYFEEESNTFFKRRAYLKQLKPFDVVLIDGLHTFQAALNDVFNSCKYLNPNGVIVMHDCYPPYRAAALATAAFPTKAEQAATVGWDGGWCGDVWKTIVYLRRNASSYLAVCVLDTDLGLGIIRPRKGTNYQELSIDQEQFAEINQLTYDDLVKDPKLLLNLKAEAYAATILDLVFRKEPCQTN